MELFVRAELDEAPGIGLRLVLMDAQVQPAGHELEPDHSVTDEWQALSLLVDEIALDELGESSVLLASGVVEPGLYERVFVRARSIDAVGADGIMIAVENLLEPIALPFRARGRSSLELVLTAVPKVGSQRVLLVAAKETRVLR